MQTGIYFENKRFRFLLRLFKTNRLIWLLWIQPRPTENCPAFSSHHQMKQWRMFPNWSPVQSVVELLYTLHEPGWLSCVCWVDDSLDLQEGSTEVQRGQWCELSFQSVIVPKLLAALPLHRCCSPDQTQKAPITVRMHLPKELLFRRSVIHIVELSGFVWTHIWASHSEFLQRHISSFCCLINDHVLLFFQFLSTCTLCSNSFTSIWSQGADSVY